MKSQKTKNNIITASLFVIGMLIGLGSSYVSASEIELAPTYVIWSSTQIGKDGKNYQIDGIKPKEGKIGEGMAWLADTADLKAQSKPKGGEFTLFGCEEVLLNRHVCKDIQFADGTSVKASLIQRGYASKK